MECVPVMSHRKDYAAAAAVRCEAICAVVGLHHSTGLEFVRNVLDAFPGEGSTPDADRGWRTRAYILSQAFLCRLPGPGFEDRLRASWNSGGAAAVHEAILGCSEFQTHRQATASLVVVPKSVPVMDVTNTAQIDFTSGIQRVVRSLAHHLPGAAPGAVLVRWHENTHSFVPLTASEAQTLATPVLHRSVPKQAGHPLLVALGRLMSWPRRKLERKLRRRRERAMRRQSRLPSLFLWDHSLLLPDLTGIEAHAEALRLLDDATPLRSTLVFYDALPIRRPEFFQPPAQAMYLRSLSLIRHVDAISCISKTVRDDLEKLLDVVPRQGPRPAVDVHYLGADFSSRSIRPAAAFELPVVLCVGTIEPRKNQTRILRAMVEAQAAGAMFTGVFAGNAGWLNGSFRQEFAAAVAAGHQLALYEHIDDGALHSLYEQAAFTVYCSLDEGFGLPIIESLRRGRPCITSDRGSMREIAEQTGGCELVDPEDTGRIAATIHKLTVDANVRSRLTREAAEASWPSWRDYTETLLRFAHADSPCAGSRAA